MLTFTYGRRHNFEALTAQQVAAALGYPWMFIEYTPQLWQGLYEDDDFKRYSVFSGNFCSLPHVGDFFALQRLSREKNLSPDAVFLPGHTPLAVAQVMQRWHRPLTRGNMHRRMCELAGFSSPDRFFKVCPAAYRNRLPTPENDGTVSPQTFFERWYWRNAETKFIFNAQRSIEYFGWSWHLPLSDRELLAVYQALPVQYRRQKLLFNRFMETINRQLQLPARKDPPSDWKKKATKNTLRLVGLGTWLRKRINRQKKINHPTCFYDIVPTSIWRQNESNPDPAQQFSRDAALRTMMSVRKNKGCLHWTDTP